MKLGKGETSFLLCYFLCIVSMFIFGDIYNKPRVLWAIFIILTFCILVTIFFELRTSRWNLIVRLAIIILFSTAAVLSRKPQMMIYAALMCAADFTCFERIVKTSFYTSGLMIILTFAADQAGIVPKRVFSRGGGVIAHAFGFGYYNVVPFTFLFMVLDYFYLKSLRKKKASWIELVVIFALNHALFKLSTLRLAYYLVLGVLILYVLLVKFNLIRLSRRWAKAISVLLFPVLFGVTLWVNYIYTESNELHVILNKILTKRLELGKLALERYPVNLFGHYIKTVNTNTEYFYVDSGFLYSLLGYGLLFTGMALLLYVYLCRFASSVNDKVLFIWLVAVAVFSMINNTWISLYINPILLYAPILLAKKGNDYTQYRIA